MKHQQILWKEHNRSLVCCIKQSFVNLRSYLRSLWFKKRSLKCSCTKPMGKKDRIKNIRFGSRVYDTVFTKCQSEEHESVSKKNFQYACKQCVTLVPHRSNQICDTIVVKLLLSQEQYFLMGPCFDFIDLRQLDYGIERRIGLMFIELLVSEHFERKLFGNVSCYIF